MKNKTFPIFLAFLCMGFGDVVGPLVGLAKESFQLSNFVAQFLSFSGFIMFGLLSVPLGVFQDRKGKKYLLVMGLIIALVGLIIPIISGMYGPKVEFSISQQGSFYILLLAILLLGAGATTLQVAGNPIMRDVSPEGKFSSNLSLAQSVKAIGSSLGFLLPPFAVAYLGLDWPVLFPVYAILIAVTLLFVYPLKVTEKKDSGSRPASLVSCLSLLGNGYVLMMVLAIFVYVGAEVSMSSGVPILLREKYGITGFGLWISWSLFFLPILVGRFLGSAILRILKPRLFLILTVIIAIVGILLLLLGSEILVFAGIIMVGLGFANIFPLVFSITVDTMPEKTNELSGLMVTAIVGGAILPPVMGAVADATSVTIGFVVPLVAVAYIALVSFRK
ncbi:MAG: MFS transporter [Bacteroidetes bacterium]|nr:MFS transporter [Bacteroidota bacterium]